MTSPDDTSPNRVATHVDLASLAERAIDKAGDARKIAMHADDRSAEALTISHRHAEIIDTIPAMHIKLDLALKPTIMPTRVSNAAVFAAASLGAMATCAVLFLALTLFHSIPAALADAPRAVQAR